MDLLIVINLDSLQYDLKYSAKYNSEEVIINDERYTYLSINNNSQNNGYNNPVDFISNNNGLIIGIKNDNVILLNDPFCTIPVYYGIHNRKIILSSNFDIIINSIDIKKIDVTGFWEILLFESGLQNRTIIKNIKQLPGSSQIKISRKGDCNVEKYWHYEIARKNYKNFSSALDDSYSLIDLQFKNLRNEKTLMGLSGGVDSRVSLLFLNKYLSKENIELFTYGYSDKILEYETAIKISKSVGIQKHSFNLLQKESYLGYIDLLAKNAGASIGIQHSHLIDSIAKHKDLNKTNYLSNSYTDALFGYSTLKEKTKISLENTSLLIKLNKFQDYFSKDVYEEILYDIKELYSGYKYESNFSNFDEFYYCTERNQKFHIHYSFLLNYYSKVQLPYCNTELLKHFIGLPLEYRFNKKLIYNLVEKYYSNYSTKKIGEISSIHFKSEQLQNWKADYLRLVRFKMLNYANALLIYITNGKFNLLNKFQTENQNVLLRKELYNKLKESCYSLKEMEVLSQENVKEILKIPLRAKNISLRFQVITLNNLLKNIYH